MRTNKREQDNCVTFAFVLWFIKREKQNKVKLKTCRGLLYRYASEIFEDTWVESIYRTYPTLTQHFIKTLFLLLEWNVYSVYKYENKGYIIILYFKKVSTKACLVCVYCWGKKKSHFINSIFYSWGNIMSQYQLLFWLRRYKCF